MSVTPPKSGLPVAVVIIIGSALFLAMAAVIVALVISLTSTSKPAQDDAEEEDVPESTQIVLDVGLADDASLTEEEFDLVYELITTRLDEINVTASEITLDDDQILITFDDDLDEDAFDAAADAVEITFSADFRAVLDSGFLCTTTQDHTDYGPDEPVTFCDQEDIAAFDLGPSEVSGESIIGANPAQRPNSEYWGVTLAFDVAGSSDLAAMTERLVAAPEGENRLVIALDGVVLASPTVEEAIINGQVGLSGSWTEAEAGAIAAQLRFASKGLTLSVDSTYLAD